MIPGAGDLRRCFSMAYFMSRPIMFVALACLFVMSTVTDELHAQAVPAGDKITFDIPAQSLARALIAYGAATGIEVFYNASLTRGLQSDQVVGVMTAEVALRKLLRGTAYIAKSTGPGTLTITKAPQETTPTSAKAAGRRQFEPYFAALQRGVSDAFCRQAGPALPHREIFYRFWISPSGVVERAEVLADNGDLADDQNGAMPLHGLALVAPPLGVPQPINMVIFPPSPGAPACGDHHKARRAGVVAP